MRNRGRNARTVRQIDADERYARIRRRGRNSTRQRLARPSNLFRQPRRNGYRSADFV